MTVVVGVEKGHECVSLASGDSDADLAKTRVELVAVDLVVSVEGIEVSESSSETSDGLGTSCLDLLSDSLEDYAHASTNTSG